MTEKIRIGRLNVRVCYFLETISNRPSVPYGTRHGFPCLPKQIENTRRKISKKKKGVPNPSICGDRNVRRRPEERSRISGAGNPNAKKPLIHGVIYGTLEEAAQALGVAQGTTIRKRIDRGVTGYSWAYSKAYLRFMRLPAGKQPRLF